MVEEYYTNKQSEEIEAFLNKARQLLIDEGLSPESILPAKVVFIKDKEQK